jgi:hypothetical protein
MTRNPVGDREDFSATYWSAILNAHAKEAVVSGCTPSKGSGDWDVDIASGEVVVGGTQVSVSADTVTLSPSDSDDRVDLVHVDSSGTVSSTEGTAATNPTAPDIPSGEVLLATVLVEGGASDLSSAGSSINDYRTIYVGGRAAMTISSATTTADEEVIGVDSSTGAITVTLASADAYLGKELVVFDAGDNASSNTITIDTEGSETIDPGGASSKTITVDGTFVRLYSDGSNWFAEGRAIDAETISTDTLTIEEPSGPTVVGTFGAQGELIASDVFTLADDEVIVLAEGAKSANLILIKDESGNAEAFIRTVGSDITVESTQGTTDFVSGDVDGKNSIIYDAGDIRLKNRTGSSNNYSVTILAN